MKKTLSFLLTLVMCVSIMPTIASASSETGRMQDEYDPETGYTTITTDDYIAVVPKGGIVEYSSDNKNLCADEVLKTTTYSNEDSIVPFDYQATVREMYEYVLKTNADMDPSSAMEIAQKLAANIEAARNASIYGNMRGITSYVTETGATVVDLGCIQDGKLVPSDALRYVPDSRTRIISEGWSVNPHVDSSVLNCRYVVPWNGLDLYKSSDSGSMTFSNEISTSQTVGFERPKKDRYVGSFYDADEVNALFAAAKGSKLELPILFGAFYGLRRSEAIGLKWDAIDFDQNTITIRHTVTSCDLDGKRVLVASDTTKTKSSMRTLPLVPFMRKRLLTLKEEQQGNRRLCGRSYIKDYIDYVCVNEIGDLIKPHYVTESFPKLLKANGLRHIRYHDLRHSCASLLLANGVPMKQIQEWLGHSDFSTTANIYAHLDYSSKLTSADAMLNGLGLAPN